MNVLGRPKMALVVVALVLLIVLLIAISHLTSNRSSTRAAGDAGDGRCAVAKRALDAFDRGEPPPAEWIQDRAAAAEAVRNCPRP